MSRNQPWEQHGARRVSDRQNHSRARKRFEHFTAAPFFAVLPPNHLQDNLLPPFRTEAEP